MIIWEGAGIRPPFFVPEAHGVEEEASVADFNRNDRWRVKRSAKHLEKVLDGLARAGGELRPKQFRDLSARLKQSQDTIEALFEEMTAIGEGEAPPAELDLDLDDDRQEAAE